MQGMEIFQFNVSENIGHAVFIYEKHCSHCRSSMFAHTFSLNIVHTKIKPRMVAQIFSLNVAHTRIKPRMFADTFSLNIVHIRITPTMFVHTFLKALFTLRLGLKYLLTLSL